MLLFDCKPQLSMRTTRGTGTTGARRGFRVRRVFRGFYFKVTAAVELRTSVCTRCSEQHKA